MKTRRHPGRYDHRSVFGYLASWMNEDRILTGFPVLEEGS